MTRAGRSHAIRLPEELIKHYGFAGTLAAEPRADGLLLKAKKQAKLSWEETAAEMARSDEDWSDWESLPDGKVEPWDAK
jgi:antitoxin component of MazEF toxin-antitoxin module